MHPVAGTLGEDSLLAAEAGLQVEAVRGDDGKVGRDLVVVAVEDGLAVHDPLAHLPPAVGAGERFEVGAELLADRLVLRFGDDTLRLATLQIEVKAARNERVRRVSSSMSDSESWSSPSYESHPSSARNWLQFTSHVSSVNP